MVDLFEHQLAGGQWLARHRRAYLGDVPGLGKTYTLLHAAQIVGAKKILVVAPAITRTHWWRSLEAMGFAENAQYIRVHSYESIVRGGEALRRSLIEQGIDALILDEAHLLRTSTAQRTKLILGKNGYAANAWHVWAASGTPMWKTPDNLWTILSSLFPEMLMRQYGIANRAQFLARYTTGFQHPQWGYRVSGGRNLPELNELLSGVMLRRTLDDVGLDVPPLFWQQWEVDGKEPEITDAESAVVAEWVTGAPAMNDTALNVALARLRRVLGEAKVPAVVQQLKEELAANEHERVVIFAHHRSVLADLGEGLHQFGVSYIDGSTSDTHRAQNIDWFQNGHNRVFIGQTVACQAGITLTAARRAIIVEPDFTANVNYQAAKRIARIGQTADRCVVQLVALAGSLDNSIVAQNIRESRMASELMDGGRT